MPALREDQGGCLLGVEHDPGWDDYRHVLAVRLRERRQALGLNQTALADAASVSRSTVQRLEAAAPGAVGLAALRRLAHALDMRMHELLCED